MNVSITKSKVITSFESIFKDKNVLISGSVGTVGSEILRQVVKYSPSEVRLLDNNESGLFMQIQKNGFNLPIIPILGDIRDAGKLQMAFQGVDVIFHCAAYKHVGLCESNPFDSVRTNVIGTQNVLKAALACGVKRLVYTSSDKAVNPTNVMGTSKLLAERVVTAASGQSWRNREHMIFSSTRFGNVLGSSGSVVPIFIDQVRNGGPVTVTHKDMTRFVMTVQEAADLVLKSSLLSCGGEVMVTKMPVIRIDDLAKVMIDLLAPVFGHKRADIGIDYIGVKPGEKLFEELMTEEEAPRSWELPELFSVLPAFRANGDSDSFRYPEVLSTEVTDAYISNTQQSLTRDELRRYILGNNILGNELTAKCRQYTHLSETRAA